LHNAAGSTVPNSPGSGLSITLAVVCCAALIAACGSSGKPSSAGGSSGYAQKLQFVVCMRSHGVPNLPDPSPNGAAPSGPYNSFEGIVIPSTINPQSPAFQSADQSCEKLLSAGSAPRPPISESQKLAAIANAQCMRKHSVPGFPDPEFPSGGGIGIQIGGPGDDPQSPAFQHAEKICGSGH
jgi:hypothetical protein